MGYSLTAKTCCWETEMMRLCLFFALSAVFLPGEAVPAATLIRSVSIIEGNATKEPTDILVEGSRIIQVGRIHEKGEYQIVDGRGLYALPGLIDAHTHLASVPGAGYRQSSASEIEQRQRIQLGSYLASGVTTVLDAAIPERTLTMLNKYVDRTGLGPRIVALRPVLVKQGGYMGSDGFRTGPYAELDAPVQSTAEIEQRLLQAVREHSFGVKVAVEDGHGPIANYVNFSDEQRAFIAETAQKNKIKLFVHSFSDSEHRRALAMNPYALLHAGYNEEPPSDAVLETIVSKGTFVVTTSAIYDLMGMMWDSDRVAREGMKYLVPPDQLATLKDPKSLDYVSRGVLKESLPSWLPFRLIAPFIHFLFHKQSCDRFLESSQRAIRKMHERGSRLVMGSDSGNWSLFTSFFHGYGAIREMEILLDAGLPTHEVIVAATSRAARMLNLSHEIGAIEAGKAADILLLKKNPLTSKEAYRSLHGVMKGGVIKSPEEWMQAAYGANL